MKTLNFKPCATIIVEEVETDVCSASRLIPQSLPDKVAMQYIIKHQLANFDHLVQPFNISQVDDEGFVSFSVSKPKEATDFVSFLDDSIQCENFVAWIQIRNNEPVVWWKNEEIGQSNYCPHPPIF